MRIALLSESREFGGAEHYLLLLARGIAPLGHEVVFFVPSRASWSAKVKEEAWGLEQCPEHLGNLLPLRMAWLCSGLKRTKPDVLHINLPSTYAASFTAGALAGRWAGCPVVTTEHLSMVGRSRRRALFKSFSTRYVRRVIAVSEATRRCLEKDHGVPAGKISVIVNGVDLKEQAFVTREKARSMLGIESGAVALGCVGELIERKGHIYAVEAMAEVVRRFPGRVQLVIIGDGEERQRLEARIVDRGLGGCVRLAGRIDGAGALLKAFDMFVMPSLMEAMPFALIESMAAGLPAVATDVYGIPEVVRNGETGLLVPPADAGALSQAVLNLLDDEDLRRRMGAAARTVAEHKFSLEAMAGKTVSLYEELASAKG